MSQRMKGMETIAIELVEVILSELHCTKYLY